MVPQNLGYQILSEYNRSRAPFPFKSIPDQVVRSNSENFVLPTNVRVTQIFTRTDFGTLLFEQALGSLSLDEPNVDVAGHDGKLAVSKHRGEKWSTTLYFSDGTYVYRLESDRRLSDRASGDFILLADQILSSD